MIFKNFTTLSRSFFAIGIMGCTISGCSLNSATPLETNYYLLNNPQKNVASENINQVIQVSVLDFPSYLQPTQLTMQMNKHQVHYARFDMWAEPLQSGFTKALLNDLNANKINLSFIPYSNEQPLKNSPILFVQVEHFHPDNASKVTLSGEYRIQKSEKMTYSVLPFSFELTLNEDGYPHAVEQMRRLVTELSTELQLIDFE